MASEFIELVPKSYGLKKQLHKTTANQIEFHHGYIAITNYKMGDNREFEKSLSVWDKMCFKYDLVGGYYVKEFKEFRVNRGYDIRQLKRFFPNYPMIVVNDAYPSDKVKVDLYAKPKSDFQKVAITFMASKGEFSKNAKYTQQVIDADTGEGKTFCGVASCAFLHSRIVIIVPFSKLLGQWKESFLKFTSVTEDQIMIVQGGKACDKIRDGECKDKVVFIAMVDTISSYQKKNGNIAVIDMFREMNAYTKIVDEIHRDMKTTAMIEALCNFRMNYYMSASPGRSEQKENWIFKCLFHNIPRFGSKFKKDDEKHINVMIKKYTFTPNSQQINRMVNRKVGMNTKSYERELMYAAEEQQESFRSSLKVMLNWSKGILVKGNKILILAQTVDFLTYIRDIAEDIFPEKVSVYYGGLKPKEKEEALKAKVIVATSSSLGTGADIKGIQFVFNCGTYSNWIDSVQLPGRARKLDNAEVVYCELVNYGFLKTVRQFEKRKPYLINRAKNGKLIVVN